MKQSAVSPMGPNGSLAVRPRRASRTQFEHSLPDSHLYLRAIEIDRTDKRAARREKQQESADLLGQNDLIIDKIIVGSEQFEKGGGRRHPVVFKCEQHNAVRFRKDSKKPSMKDAIRNRQKASLSQESIGRRADLTTTSRSRN